MNCKNYPDLIRPQKQFSMVRRIIAMFLFTAVFITLARAEVITPEMNYSTTHLETNVDQQQKKRITGTIVDTDGYAIIGANIIEIGTSIELDLESGDVGIEDTLYSYFTDEYQYIEKLAGYLKQWVRSIKIRDCLPRTSLIPRFYVNPTHITL